MYKTILSVLTLLLLNACLEEVSNDFELNIRVSPEETGIVSTEPILHSYPDGSSVTLTASPITGWQFDTWVVNSVQRGSNPLNLTMNSNKHVRAEFIRKEYSLQISIDGEGSVLEKPLPAKYEHGTLVQLDALPANLRWEFISWSGSITGQNNPETILIDREGISVTAQFSEKCCLRTYGGSNRDESHSLVITPDGGTLIAGSTNSGDGTFENSVSGSSNLFLLKTGQNGTEEWAYTYGGSGRDETRKVIATQDGGYLMVGSTESGDGDFNQQHKGNSDLFLAKISAQGVLQWVRMFGGTGHEEALDVTVAHGGGYLLTGWADSNDGDLQGINPGGRSIFFLKTDQNGVKEWIRVVGGTATDMAFSVIKGTGESYLFTGWSTSNDGDLAGTSPNDYDFLIGRLNSNGQTDWINSYGGSGRDRPSTILENPDGSIMVAGTTTSGDGDFAGPGFGSEDIFLMKSDASGLLLWTRTYGGSASDLGLSLAHAPGSGYYLTGSTVSIDGDFSGISQAGRDLFLIRTDTGGELQWARTFRSSQTGQGQSEANELFYSPDGTVRLTGWSNSNSGYFGGLGRGDRDAFLLRTDENGMLTLP